jgi:DNA polymerase
MLYIDFETRSETDLRVTGPYKYSISPTTEVLCMAYKIDDGPVELLDLENINPNLFENTDVEAHNAMFEYCIYHNVLKPKYNLPPIPQHRWYCSLSWCARLGLPKSLEGAAQALDINAEKDMTGNRLMLKLCKPRPTWKNKGTGDKWFGTPEEFQALAEYCKQDVLVEYQLSQKLREYVRRDEKS